VKQSTSGSGFLKRTAISVLISAIVLGIAIAWRFGWAAGAGFVAAAFWGLANFAVLGVILRTATDPGGVRRWPLVGWVLLKVFGLYGLGVLVLMAGWFPVPALAAGFGLPLVLVLLRALGTLVDAPAKSPSKTAST
jgi:hypothetical protein